MIQNSRTIQLRVSTDPTRQTLVERLRAGPLPVGELAAGLPVIRPAVSKHLRLMKGAGVVR
jgi:DNA-binding transcriptional ArsR family regulator